MTTAYYNSNAKPGSLASKANMVKKFEEKNEKK
jgi:YidC/Oxa1 family membrane protein insertase